MDYTNYKVDDFAANESFIDWVNQSDPEAIKFWNLYIAEHPQIRTTVEKARILVLNIRKAEEIPHDAAQIDAMWESIQYKVETHTPPTPEPSHTSARPRLVLISVVLLATFTAGWLIFQPKDTATKTNDYQAYQKSLPDYTEQVNTTGKPMVITLADGSIVTLENNGRLKYNTENTGDSTREVYLLGEAFFEVTPNPFKPFIVRSNEVFTKVLGTSFRIAAPENGRNFVVSVKTGKVSVYALKANSSGNKKEGVILLPNQQVSYERSVQAFDKMLVPSPEIVNTIISKADFKFENTPIAEVFKKLETAYGIEIIFNPETMKNCFLTAPLGSESLQEKMAVICKTLGASYEVIDAKIIVSSAGC